MLQDYKKIQENASNLATLARQKIFKEESMKLVNIMAKRSDQESTDTGNTEKDALKPLNDLKLSDDGGPEVINGQVEEQKPEDK